MTRRILAAAILIPCVLASLLLLPLPVFLLILTLLLFLAFREFGHVASVYGSTIYPATYLVALISPWIFSYAPKLTGPYSITAILIALVWCVCTSKDVKMALPSVAGNLLGLCYLVIPFSLMASFHRASPQSGGDLKRPYELILVLSIVWISDAAALFIGRVFGKHKITPYISPNKTLEGFLAALVVPIIAAVLLGRYLVEERSFTFFLSAGLIISLASVVGDLFESILKRGAEIKDTSNLIPGHGGVLDRIDSLLFALPAYYVFAVLST